MLRIAAHIERLLWTQDCVILPGWGGFMCQTQPAAYDESTHTFRPAHKELSFNATLRHGDGLLAEAYRKAYGVDYPQAQLLVEQDSEALRSQLQAERQVSLGHLGTLSLGDEEQLIFTPGDEAWLNADRYGLSAFTYTALPSALESSGTSTEEPVQKPQMYYIPIHRRVLQGVAGTAAAVLLFFWASTPVHEVSPAAYTASFVPTEITVAAQKVADTAVEEPLPLMESEPKVEEPVAAVEAETKVNASEPTPVVTPEAPRKMYHLVIASFPTEAQANTFMSTVDRQQYREMGKVTRGGKCRVYAARFDNRAEAERQLAQLRQTDRFKDAWLFISK